MAKKSAHRKALEWIALHPTEFCQGKKVVASLIEANLFDKGRMIAQPDVVFYCTGKEIYIIEYKGNGNGELLQRAQEQLNRAAFWFGKYTDFDSEKIYTKIVVGKDLR